MAKYLPCATPHSANRIIFEETNPQLPLVGTRLLCQDGKRGVVTEFTCHHVDVKWDGLGVRTYDVVSFGPVI